MQPPPPATAVPSDPPRRDAAPVPQVFFRKYTQAEAQRLGLHGWCENTARGTVQGELEGPTEAVRQMKTWLRTTGSPNSEFHSA